MPVYISFHLFKTPESQIYFTILYVALAAFSWHVSYLQPSYLLIIILRVISGGVFQGSVLGPILYLLYTGDIPKCDGVTTATFADDTALDVYKRQWLITFLILFESALHECLKSTVIYSCIEYDTRTLLL